MARVVASGNKILEIKDVKKSFFNNSVLKGVNFHVCSGDVLGLLGSNGAGKSTLMKIINGIYAMDSGETLVDGKDASITTATDAQKHGIAMVYQEFSLIPTLTVAQNIFLNNEPKTLGIIDDHECRQKASELLSEFGVNVTPDTVIENLSIGNQQLVEIVKALAKRPRILILDEPTASLTSNEIELLFGFVNQLRKKDIAILFISHHMQEIMTICNRAIVLRNGVVELDDYVENLSVSKMVDAMVGKSIANDFLPPANEIDRNGLPKLEVKNLSYGRLIDKLSLKVYAGEIVGIAGLLGSGRTEILESIMNINHAKSVEITVDGQTQCGDNPWDAISSGLYLVPEDRRRSGIVPIHDIKTNILMSIWVKFKTSLNLINDKLALKSAEQKRNELDIVCRDLHQEVQELSGGNQQKVVLSKALMTNPKVLLLDDPTVGVDVEAKDAIAKLIRLCADTGSGVIIASSEIDQLAKICDRVLILSNGKITKELVRGRDEITEKYLNELIQS